MINSSFTISFPFVKEKKYRNLYNRNVKVSTNKFIELEFTKYNLNLFELEFSSAFRGYDHAGPYFTLGLFGYSFYVKLYDKRHWDYINNCWENYEYTNS